MNIIIQKKYWLEKIALNTSPRVRLAKFGKIMNIKRKLIEKYPS